MSESKKQAGGIGFFDHLTAIDDNLVLMVHNHKTVRGILLPEEYQVDAKIALFLAYISNLCQIFNWKPPMMLNPGIS